MSKHFCFFSACKGENIPLWKRNEEKKISSSCGLWSEYAARLAKACLLVLGALLLVLEAESGRSSGANGCADIRRMPPKSGKAKKELLKGKKEERKTSGRGAGFSSVVCDWGSTAVNSAPPAGSKAAEDLANAEKQGPTWTGTQLSGSGAETTTRGESWAPRRGGGFGSRGGRAGGAPGLLVQAPRNKLSTFFQRENDHDVQQRKLDASRPLERTAHTAQDAWAHITPRPLPWPLPLVDGAFVPVIPIPKRPPWRRDMTQGELEKQEQAMFAKWTERIFAEHGRSSLNHFEHNLEVCRQQCRAVRRALLLALLLDLLMTDFLADDCFPCCTHCIHSCKLHACIDT
jgi:hypothetical protein